MADKDENDLESYTEYDWFALRIHFLTVGILLVTMAVSVSMMVFLRFQAIGIFAAMLPVFVITVFIRMAINYLMKIQFGIIPSMPAEGWKAVQKYIKENFTAQKRKQISKTVIGICAAGLVIGLLLFYSDNAAAYIFFLFMIILGFIFIYLSLLKSDIEENL